MEIPKYGFVVIQTNDTLYWLGWLLNQKWFQPTLDTLTVLLLALSAIVAWRAWGEAARSNLLKLAPVLGISFHKSLREKKEGPFRIKNYGQGVAYDIEIEPWIFMVRDTQEIIVNTFKRLGTNILGPGEERGINFESEVMGKSSSNISDFMHHVMRYKGIALIIKCKDAMGNKWWTKVIFTQESINIVEPPRPLGILSGIRLWLERELSGKLIVWREKFLWKFEDIGPASNERHLKRFANIFWPRKAAKL